jgi:hypothetical protein
MIIKQIYKKGMSFWPINTNRIYNDLLWTSLTQSDGKIKISIPATSRVVERNKNNAAYLRYPFYFEPATAMVPQTNRLKQTYIGERVCEIYRAAEIDATSDGNLSTIPNIEAGDILLVENSINNGPAELQNLTDYFDNHLHVGVFGQAYYEKVNFSNTQYAWIVPGNSNIGTAVDFDPISTINLISSVYDFDTDETTISNTEITGEARLFPTCCVIESDVYKNRLLYVGGLTAHDTQTVSALIINKDNTHIHTTACPEGMAQSTAISIPVSQYILINGGLNNALNDSKNSSYFFNPFYDTWIASTGNLNTPRRLHQIAILDRYIDAPNTNHALIIGGKQGILFDTGQEGPDSFPVGIPINKCEIMDIHVLGVGTYPVDTYHPTGSMSYARYAFGMTNLIDGRVLVCGGIGNEATYPITATDREYNHELKTCEIFDPDLGIWSPIPDMLEAHSYCVCKYVPDTNKVYVYGSYTSRLIEYLDLNTMTWHKSVYSLDQAIVGATPLALENQIFALIGGGTYNSTFTTFTPNNDVILGSTCNQIRANTPEYTRYDGLNDIWKIESYDNGQNLFTLTSNSIGDYRNTDIRWSDPNIDGIRTRFILFKAVEAIEDDIVGPFTFDNEQAFTLSNQELILNQNILQGTNLGQITVTQDAFDVEEGWIIINYGYENQTGPIKCLGAIDNYTLRIDSGFKFPYSLHSTSVIIVLSSRDFCSPSYVGAFWATASNAGRTACIKLIEEVVAAGIELNITTRYPEDRGLAGEGWPTSNSYKLSDIVECFGRDDIDTELLEIKQQSFD